MARVFASGNFIDVSFGAGDTGSPVSPSCWFKTTAATGALICSDTNSGSGRVFQFKVAANVIQYFIRVGGTGGTNASVNGLTTVTDGAWHHSCATYDGAHLIIYTDGVVDNTLAFTLTPANNLASRAARIGAQIASVTQQFFVGSIMDAAIFERVLGPGEAKSLAAGLPASHLGPSHYWPLWGADSPEPDIGTLVHANGTLTGTTAAHGVRVGLGLV